MKIGMMWARLDKKKSWEDEINEAYKFYVSKYGHNPDVCYLYPQVLTEDVDKVLFSTFAEKKLSIESAPYIVKNCFWIGVNKREDYRDCK